MKALKKGRAKVEARQATLVALSPLPPSKALGTSLCLSPRISDETPPPPHSSATGVASLSLAVAAAAAPQPLAR
jgi:hypothetical protein